MSDSGPDVPIESIFNPAAVKHPVGTIPALPYIHAVSSIGSLQKLDLPETAEALYNLYRTMLQAAGLNSDKENGLQSGPYNLLLTREWMMLIPRSCEFFEEVSVNALGFAGALLVRSESQIKRFREFGPMNVLKKVSIPFP
jgi:ATP adenylyltransferase